MTVTWADIRSHDDLLATMLTEHIYITPVTGSDQKCWIVLCEDQADYDLVMSSVQIMMRIRSALYVLGGSFNELIFSRLSSQYFSSESVEVHSYSSLT